MQANELIKFLPKKELIKLPKKRKEIDITERVFLTEIIQKHNTSSGSETHVNLTAKSIPKLNMISSNYIENNVYLLKSLLASVLLE